MSDFDRGSLRCGEETGHGRFELKDRLGTTYAVPTEGRKSPGDSLSIRPVSHRLVRWIPSMSLAFDRPSVLPLIIIPLLQPLFHWFPRHYDPPDLLKGRLPCISLRVGSMGPVQYGQVQAWLGMGAYWDSVSSKRYLRIYNC